MARESMKKKRAEKSDHIIEIATEVFSEKGYHGALTDEIAEGAGISKRSMYYYIGDKDMLYEAVMKNLLEQASNYLYYEQNENSAPEIKIRRLIRGMAYLAKMRPLHSIVMRELFEGGRSLPAGLRKELDKYLEKFVLACEEFRKNEGGGDASPLVLAMMVFATFQHWDITMPYMYEGQDCTQHNAIEAIGPEINEILIMEVEKIVFKMLATGK